MFRSSVPFWKESPFTRLVLPFAAGIVTEYYLHPGVTIGWLLSAFALTVIALFSLTSLSNRFSRRAIFGYALTCLWAGLGLLITAYHDITAQIKAIDTLNGRGRITIVTITEPLSEKPSTWKATTKLISARDGDTLIASRVKILLYFRKDSMLLKPVYGSRIAFATVPQRISNAGIQGRFDYRGYCERQDIYYRVFLRKDDFVVLPGLQRNKLNIFLFAVQEKVVRWLKQYIPGEKECGLAEALLIGYKDDLNRSLIEAYTNTGVVHVVAISGLHLGLIYALLKYACIPFHRKRSGKWISLVIILTGLWLFALLCGGSPSVLRSAVMFSFIVLGECIARRSSVINNLAASALVLLCYNPYWLWDIGFQLSYTALLSIVIYQRAVYNWFFCRSKFLDAIWKLNAVTLAAQILTLPVCIYHFGQFPVLFLPANIIAVPLSSVILIGEIALCTVSLFEVIAAPLGKLLSFLIWLMNVSVEWINSIPHAALSGLEISFVQLVVCYLFICAVSCWLMMLGRRMLTLALLAAILFMVLRLI